MAIITLNLPDNFIDFWKLKQDAPEVQKTKLPKMH